MKKQRLLDEFRPGDAEALDRASDLFRRLANQVQEHRGCCDIYSEERVERYRRTQHVLGDVFDAWSEARMEHDDLQLDGRYHA